MPNMVNHKSSRLPLHDLSNGYHIIYNNNNNNNNNNKRRKTLIKPSIMTSIVKNINNDSNIKIQMDDLIKLKNDKQNDLNNLNSEIWKIQNQISDLELKTEKLNSNLQIVKSNFQSLENKISNLNLIKSQNLKSIDDSLIIFKEKLDKSFDDDVINLTKSYDNKITNLINSNHSNFKINEKNLIDKIKILKNSLNDYSNEKLINLKLNIEIEFKSSIETLKLNHNNNIKNLNLKISNLLNESNNLKDKINLLNTKNNSNLNLINNDLLIKLNNLNKILLSIQSNELILKQQLKSLNNSKDEECNKLLNLKEKYRQFNNEINNFNEEIKNEEAYRRFLHNKLQELKGNIRVFCRIKPDFENIFNHRIEPMSCTDNLKETLIISEPSKNKSRPSSSSSSTSSLSPTKTNCKSYSFSFDKIFDEHSSNADIFEEISQLVQSSLDGFNVCIFTYGQTGSGKTFTMSNLNDGMIPRSLSLMFEKIDMLSTLGKNYQLFGQFFEIYGDNINDLIDLNDLNDLKNIGNNNELNLNDSELNNINLIKLTSIDQIETLLNHTTKKRTTASTMANDVSSRSHSIFKVYISNFNNEISKFNILGTLNLVDLAGSERLSHSQVKGIRLKETLSINKSLSSLGDVIASLKSKSSHIPYRNSKLTYILKDSLGGDSKTLMFVNICCLNSHFNESLSSLRFASKVNNTSLK